MKKLIPFKAQRYNESKTGSLSFLVSPPYDVISSDLQEKLYDRSSCNFVRLDLNRGVGLLRYQAAKEIYSSWMSSGFLIQEEQPSFYFHQHSFTLPTGKEVTRKGFFALRRLEDFGSGRIKPHEKTLDGPKADRLELMRALQAQLSPVFSLYSDPAKVIDSKIADYKNQKPLYDFRTLEDERHQVWAISNLKIDEVVDHLLGEQALFIADGHHRYETALNYRNERRLKSPPGNAMEPFNYILMYLSNMDDEGLIILPIHRSVHHLKNFDEEVFFRKLKDFFILEEMPDKSPAAIVQKLNEIPMDQHAYAIHQAKKNRFILASIPHARWLTLPLTKDIPSSLQELDVVVLHRFIFEELLGMTIESQAKQENIIYWKDTQKALDETSKGHCDLTFLLRSTPIDAMRKVALSGNKMPQKSTFFYPKVPSGVVWHNL